MEEFAQDHSEAGPLDMRFQALPAKSDRDYYKKLHVLVTDLV